MTGSQFIAAALFISCAIALYLSAKNHRWLFYNALAVITGYALVSFTGEGGGTVLQYIGGIIGIIGGLLILRGAFQRETGKQYQLAKPLNNLDLYPLASAGGIEGSCAFFIAIGSFINGDINLAIVASLWVIAHLFLISSDEYLRKRIGI